MRFPMSSIETMQEQLADYEPGEAAFEQLRDHLTSLERREQEIRTNLMCFFPKKDPHLDQFADLIRLHWDRQQH